MEDLYSLTGEYLNLLQAAEKTEEIALTREKIDAAVLDCCQLLTNLSGEEKAVDAEVKRLNARKKMLKNEQEKIRETLLLVLNALDISKMKNAFYTLSVRESSSPSLVIDDESAIPEEFLVPGKPTVNNDKLKKYLKELRTLSDEDSYDDEDCAYAHLEYKTTLTIK